MYAHKCTHTVIQQNYISMSVIRISPPTAAFEPSKPHFQSDLNGCPPFHCNYNPSVCEMDFIVPHYVVRPKKFHRIGGNYVKALSNIREEGSTHGDLDSMPVAVELKLISSESQFDRVIAEAQQLDESVVILWMASWCRKCIYLKPKLEKLAADYHPRIRFYCVDVNNVPHKLVVRAGITKMPTIQLWKDGKKQDEVIGGHKAYLVVNEVREMIESEFSL